MSITPPTLTPPDPDAALAVTAPPPGVLMPAGADHRPRGRPGDRLHALFEGRCRALADAGQAHTLAIDQDALTLRYAELDALAHRLAAHLAALGRRPGDRIGLVLDKGHWSCAAMLAIGKLEAVYVPMDPGFPADRVAFIAEDAELAQVLTTGRHRALAEATGLPVLCLDEAAVDIDAAQTSALATALKTAANRPDRSPDGDALCYIIYTSGSTGRPKGVPIGHAQIVNFVKVAAEVYGYRADDRVYQGLTLAFDFAVEEIWVPLVLGATLVPNDTGGNLLGADLADFLRRRRVTALCCVPTLLATLEDTLPDLRLLIVSGEACPRDLVQRWHRPGRRFLNAYGPTEATVTATLGQPQPGRPVTIGRPLPTYAIVILPPGECRALPFGDEGEIGIAGIGIAQGYLQREAQTRAAFIPDALGLPHNPSGLIYRTGDLGRINADGEVEYLGRIDTQVKIRGYRIELAEIESLLMQCAGVAQAVVNPWESSPGAVELVAYYTAAEAAAPPDPQALASALRSQLPPYMVPSHFEHLPAMPMLASDKADRKCLPPPSGERLVTEHTPYEAPADGLEQHIAAELMPLLGLQRVSATAHLFNDLGMSSLLLARLAARLRSVVPAEAVSMRLLYGSPTVRALAQGLAAWQAEAAASSMGAITGGSEGSNGGDGPAAAGAGTRRPVWPDLPLHRASRSAYLACGAAQLLLLMAFAGAHAAAWWVGLHQVMDASSWADATARALGFAALYSAASVLLPIALKWLLVGRMQPKRFPAWSLAYLRFWCVRGLVRSSPVVLLAGTPLYAWYLRALGARLHPSALVALRVPPAAPDMLSVGAEAVIGHHANVAGYRVLRGWVETGPVVVGDHAEVGEFAVLDIHTRLGESARLAHASSLQAGQVIPAGAHWHGSPAQPVGPADAHALPAAERSSAQAADPAQALPAPSRWRRLRFALVQLVLAWGLVLPLPALLAFAIWGESGHALDGLGSRAADLAHRAADLADGPSAGASGGEGNSADSWRSLLQWLGLVLGAYLASWVAGLIWVATVPRWCARLLPTNRPLALYGWHHWWLRFVRGASNVAEFNTLFGDASAIVHYLRAIGWRLPGLKQTGSNFGLAQQHDVPTLVTVGSGTMVSDGLTLLNARWGSRGFTLAESRLGAGCFLGNAIVVPAGHRVGDDCLLASKVMLPLEGPLREGTGLLGSPPMVIPRQSSLGGDPSARQSAGWLAERLRAKASANHRSMAGYLAVQAASLLALTLAWHELYPLAGQYEGLFAALFLVGAFLFNLVWRLFIDAASRGFSALQPRQGSIYESAFWRHERHWKLGLAQDSPFMAVFAGTPLRGLLWRAMGVQVGRQLLDDGCAITEKTLTRLGHHCTLGAVSTLQGHSLEDGNFRSDRLWLGDGVSIGSQCYVHYDTRLGDGALVMHDAFVMKGSQLAEGELWAGNPAQPMGQSAPATVASPAPAALPAAERPLQPATDQQPAAVRA